ncbi:MAG TPA: RNA polymerase subunit sigma-24, partial [Mycobacteriales bacterium]|nr:RNA polymerase subunit sigma-24 [Mycobacteriales bacterium]
SALEMIDRLVRDGHLEDYLYLHSSRAELLRRLDRPTDAAVAYRKALELATATPERRFLTGRLENL